jgi:hypothetical protein
LTIWKKAVSVGTTAALLASLLITAVAPAAFAASTATGGGVIIPDQAASAPFALTFAEDTVGQFANGSFTVTVLANDGVADVHFVTTTAPTVTRNNPSGTATAAFVGGNLVVTVSGTDVLKLESWTISGLKVYADATAAQGAVIFEVGPDGVGLSQTLQTASGTVVAFTGSGVAQTIGIAIDAGSPKFDVTGTACVPSAVGSVGKATVAASGASPLEAVTVTATDGTTSLTGVFTQSKPTGVVVTQPVCASRFPSVVTVGDAIVVDAGAPEVVQAGVKNQSATFAAVQLGYFDYLLLVGDTVTATIQTAGVTFSTTGFNSYCTLSQDAKALACDVGTLFGTAIHGDIGTWGGDVFTWNSPIDVAAGVATGTTIDFAFTTSRAGVTILGTPATVAVVGNLAAGVSANPTNVIIGQNNQPAGVLTITERHAGAIDGTMSVCLRSSSDAEWAGGRNFWVVRTAGDATFNVGGLPATQAKMLLNSATDCISFKIYDASTVASAFQIVDGSSTAPILGVGPRVNVDLATTPGPVAVDVSGDTFGNVATNVVIAYRVFSGTAVASVSGQLPVLRGMLNQASGSITITEGAPNQFVNGYFWLCIVDPAYPNNDAYNWSSPVGVNQPIVTTNNAESGLTARFIASESDTDCLLIDVLDTGVDGLGRITVSNLKLDVKTDAPLGPVFVNVYGRGGDDYIEAGANGSTWGWIEQTVSPATVIAKKTLNINATSALGNNPTSGYTTKTPKVQVAGQYVTWKFTGGATLANQRVNILVAKRINGAWGGPQYLKSAWADANGIVTFTWKASAGTVLNARAQWPGSATYNVSTSPALGAHWQ